MKTKNTAGPRSLTNRLLPAMFAGIMATLLAVPQASAQTNIWSNPITAVTPNLSNPFTTGDVVASNLTVSGIGRGSGISGANADNRYNANNWSTGAIDLNDYFSFTLDANAGFEIDFNSFVYTGQISGGASSQAFRSSLDSFTANIGTPTVAGATISLSGAAYQNLTAPIEFRLYTFGVSAGTRTVSVNDFYFTGNINATGGGGTDYYWTGNGTTLGGSGTWATTGNTWSATNSPVTGTVWDPAKKAIFTNSADTVTVSTVTASNGIQFATDGYTLTGGTLTMGGTTQASNTITTDTSINATINTKLSGTAGIAKAGAGNLTLGGANDYTGGTTVSAGRLIGTTTSLQGIITNNGAVTFDQTTNGTYASTMSGTGSLRKSGAGEVTLTGENSYSGGTEVAAGRLIGDTRSLQGAITNNAAVTLSQTTNGTYAGPMTGTGSLRKSGAGDVTLTGANTYSGGTEVAAGRLIGDTRSLQGAITNNAATTFSQTTNGTYAGAMTGTGSLLKAGAGTVTLGGANSYSGGTEVAAGRLVGTTASLQGAITNNAAVTFDQATNGTYSGEMSGSGALTKSGSGAVTVTGDNSYAGGTTVNAGSLVATTDTALGSGDVAINEGSVLATDGVTLSNDFTIGSTATAVTNSFTVSYNFGTTSGTASPSSSDAVGFTIGDVSQGNNNGTTTLLTTTSASSGYAGASGQYNAGAAAFTGALNTGTSTYFEFNLTRTAATSVTLADVTFGSRSTSTAPQAYSIRETGDLATSLASDTMANNSVWALENAAFTDTLIASGGGTTFRIYGYNGTGSPTVGTANWRIDDLTLTGESVTGGAGGGSGTLGIEEEGTASFTGGITINTTATFTAATDATAIFSGIVSGPGTDLAKTGGGTVTLSGSSANTFAGTTTVEEGTLRLNKTAGTTAIEGDLEVATGATLLISASNQVANTSEVTLSGGTIARGGGVSEVFGDLNLTADSFIDFGTGAIGSLQFGTYSPTELLTVSNFLIGNTLIFGSDLTSTINNASFFSFDNGFTTDYSGGLFTITAIPEPSTYVAAAGLLALMAWPVRRRLVRDVKSILGLRAPMRDRLARKA